MVQTKRKVGMGRLRQTLKAEDARRASSGIADPGLAETRQSLGRMLYDLYRRYDGYVVHRLHQLGFDEIRPVHTNIIREVALTGTVLGEIAARANVTKQSASQVVKELVELGYLRAMIDPADARTRVVIFSDRGMALINSLGRIFEELDSKFSAHIGGEELARLRSSLSELLRLPLADAD